MGLTLRYQSTTNYYFCGYVKGDAGLSIYKTIAGTGTKLATISESLSTSTFYWIRWRMATNTAGTAITFYAKMWQDGNSEQSTWDISAVESTNILSSGTVGIVANPVTTATVSFDSYTVNQVFDSIGTTRATFYTQFKALTDATQVKFITARALIGKTKDLFRTSSVIKGITRGTFNTKIVGMKGAGREKFYTAKRLLSGLLETFINNRVVYNQWFNLRATSVKSLISLKFGDVPVAQPYSSIQVKVTAMNASNAAISNLASLTCVVTFPDGSVSPVYSLGGAITNTGGGTYILIYNTLMQGINNELWVATDLSGDISQYLNKTPVIY